MIGIYFRVLNPFRWQVFSTENCSHWTDWYTSSTRDALYRIDEQHLRLAKSGLFACRMNAINGAGIHTRSILRADAWFCYHVGACLFVVRSTRAGRAWIHCGLPNEFGAFTPAQTYRNSYERSSIHIMDDGASILAILVFRQEHFVSYASRQACPRTGVRNKSWGEFAGRRSAPVRIVASRTELRAGCFPSVKW